MGLHNIVNYGTITLLMADPADCWYNSPLKKYINPSGAVLCADPG